LSVPPITGFSGPAEGFGVAAGSACPGREVSSGISFCLPFCPEHAQRQTTAARIIKTVFLLIQAVLFFMILKNSPSRGLKNPYADLQKSFAGP
jgi:hypothetical protein